MQSAQDLGISAREVARLVVALDENRRAHVAGVARAASRVGLAVDRDELSLLVTAAWLHDVGYAEEAVDSGFHPLDGARFLSAIGVPDRLCCLVANHTHAWVEADARGLAGVLSGEFPREDSPTADGLTYADLTTGPTGESVSVEARLADIYDRYPPGHVVHESIRRAEPDLIATVRRVEARLDAAHPR